MSNQSNKKVKEEFWITNFTKRAVNLSDIGVIIYPMRSINLLDRKHYNIDKKDIELSYESGSLYKRRNEISRRLIAPIQTKKRVEILENAVFTIKKRSAVEIDKVVYEELNVSDDDYAAENADMAEVDYLGKYNK